MKDCYTTLDVYQASFLILKGFVPSFVTENEKVVFSFELSPQLLQALSAYNSGAIVKANELANTVKLLKSRVFAMKREFEERMEKEKRNDNNGQHSRNRA